MGDTEAEGAVREGRDAIGGEEEDEAVARSYQDTLLPGKLWQAVRQATDREGGGCFLPDGQCTKTGRLVAEVSQEKHPYMCVTPVENPVCISFEEYEDMPELVSLNFTEDDVPRVASMLSGAAGALGAVAFELRNWLLRFGCVSEELRVIVSILDNWMPPPLGCLLRTNSMSPGGA